MKRSANVAPLEEAEGSVADGSAPAGVVGWPRRIALALAGGSFGATAASILDAAWAKGSASAENVSLLPLARIDVGLNTPVALLVGGSVALFGLVVEPDRLRSPGELSRGLLLADPAQRRRLAACAVPLAVSVPLWATGVAEIAKRAMAGDASSLATGLTVALAALAAALVALVVAFAAGEVVAAAWARSRVTPDPRKAVVSGVLLVAALMVLGVSSGTTGGEGGWLGIWGVLKRPELDLRATGLLLAIALGAYVLPHVIKRSPFAALALGLAPLAFTYQGAVTLARFPEIAASLERGAPLGKMSLAVLRRATDRDHDGFSPLFGGGDCNDHDPRINPQAVDIPGNGIDEDCSGSDAPVLVPREPDKPESNAPSSRLPKGLNVILITVDTLRADLGFAGNPKPLSPNLDALAARSVVFERAYSLASYTGKSVGPLMIGKYPSETHRGWGHFNRFTAEDVMVAERLQRAGIRTIGVHAHYYFSAAFGLARGFDVWDTRAQPPPGSDQDNDATITGGALTDSAIRVLSDPQNTESRFFAWIHYLDPHADYAKHPEAPDLGSGMRAAYDGEVWYADHQIGRLLEFFAHQQWADKTAIVVTSDHGEAFGEHHMIRHGFELWEELVRVPLLFAIPGVEPHHVSARRSAIDLVPSLLDLMGVDPNESEPRSEFDFLSGHSLAGDLAMSPGQPSAERDILVDMPAGPNNDERRAFIHEGRKLYISNAVRYQLFDLDQDPGEKNDLAGDKELLADMKERYQAFRSGMREVIVRPVSK